MAQQQKTGIGAGINRREELIRLVQFCFVGAYVAAFNLVLTYIMSQQATVPYAVYVPIIIEITICASFVLNDVLTFSKLKKGGHTRLVRLLRFHGSAGLGAITQIGVSLFCRYILDLPPLVAQFIAIGFGTVVNFSMHRFWTYRKPKAKPATAPAPLVSVAPVATEALD